MILVWVSSNSDMKYISILLSCGTLAQQMFMLTLWTVYDKYKKKQDLLAKTSPEEALLPKTQLKPWPADGKKKTSKPDIEVFASVRSGETISEEEAIKLKQPKQEPGSPRGGGPSKAPSKESDNKPLLAQAPSKESGSESASKAGPAALTKAPSKDSHGKSKPMARPFKANKEIQTPPGTPGVTPIVTPEASPRTEAPTTPLLGTPRAEPPTFGAAPLTPR